jgi:hypothetical protein
MRSDRERLLDILEAAEKVVSRGSVGRRRSKRRKISNSLSST